MGSFASCFLLFGIALIFGATGTFDMAKIADYTIQNQTKYFSIVLYWNGIGGICYVV